MSLHFSDDDLYEENNNKEKNESDNLNYDFFTNDKNDNTEGNEKKYNDENYMEGEEYDETKEDLEKKKKKKSVVFQLKNLFNDVALNKINKYIQRKRKSEHRNSYEDHANTFNEDDYEGSSDEDELQKYVRKEKNKIKQILPEKDELWEMYIYLNLKKKKRKIDYNEKYYSSAIKKILENVEKEYIGIIKEKLFQNKNLIEYLIISDFSDFLKNNNIENIEKNTEIPLIRKKNSLIEIKKRLIELYNKGNCCSYIKEVHFFNDRKEENLNEQEDGNNNSKNYENYKRQNTNFIVEKEKLNLLLSKLSDKYSIMINRIKKHRRKDLRTNFNLFMNLMNEVTSKLYFSIHNVLLMDDNNSNIADIYKTIRRKYNIHDVLSKVQKLTKKKEIYEHYRSYLLYKYKTTYPLCDDVFKNHTMKDNINIFNFKKFYNTEFSKEKFFLIKEDKPAENSDANISGNEDKDKEIEEDINDPNKRVSKSSTKDLFSNDVYNDDFFNVNVQNKGSENLQNNSNSTIPEKKEKHNQSTNNNNNASEQKEVNNENKDTNVEETPLERAKRIAREKKKKLLESRIKII